MEGLAQTSLITRGRGNLQLGPSKGRNDQVEMRPPTLPNMTLVPMAEDLAVSESTLAATCALQRAPNAKAPLAMRKVAPYLTWGFVLARNMM